MKKFVKNITGEGKFPEPQELAYRENGKIVLIKSQEKIETNLPHKIGENLNEPRLVVVGEEEKEVKKKKGE